MKLFDLVALNSNWSEDLKLRIRQNTDNLFSKIDYVLDEAKINNPIGLLVGKIQSGKTGTIIGATANAFDKGYRMVIIYLSDQYALYEQNMQRIKDSFSKNDEKIVFIDNSSVNEDLKIYQNSPSDIDFHLRQGKSFLIFTLKNYIRINNISKVFSQSKITKEKILIIDDEGDDISQNTRKTKHLKNLDELTFTPNNEAIVRLMSKFEKYVFVSVTATPQAPLLIYKFEHLSPNFCALIYPGDDYTGLQTFHSGDYPSIIETVEDYSLLSESKKGLPRSLKKAIMYFLFTGALRKYTRNMNGEKIKHSFLIHVEKKIVIQKEIFDRVQTYLEILRFTLGSKKASSELKHLKELFLQIVDENTTKLSLNSTVVFEDFQQFMHNILLDLKLILLNGKQANKNLKNLVYGREFFVIIGGDMLDRGLTIDGLAVSYFTRESKKTQADTLLQRARWYGYKQEYISYCKLFTTGHIEEQFEAALEHENSVWDFLEIFENTKNDLRKIETTFRIDTGLIQPTSNAKAKWNNFGIEKWFVQNYFNRNPELTLQNNKMIENLFIKDFTINTFNSNFKSKVKTVNFEEFYDFIKNFKFSAAQKKDFVSYIDVLSKANSDFNTKKFDIVYLRFEQGEERKVLIKDNTFYLSNIMQGRSHLTGNYPGDRNIISENPMLQIHKVILKSDAELYKKGDIVFTIAFGLPTDFITSNLITGII